MNESTVQSFHLNQQFLIVVTKSVQNISVELQNIFGIVFNLGLLNVNVLVGDKDSLLMSLHFYEPYTQDCHSISIHEIGKFSQENYTSQLNVSFMELFPPKALKFRNCPLYIAVYSVEPFVIINQPFNGSSNTSYEGIDVVIINKISKNLNLVPKYMQPPDNMGRGIAFKNGTATGTIKMVNMFK